MIFKSKNLFNAILILATQLTSLMFGFVLDVVYFDQLLGAARTWKLVEQLFFSRFQNFLFIFYLFQWFHTWKKQKMSFLCSYSDERTTFSNPRLPLELGERWFMGMRMRIQWVVFTTPAWKRLKKVVWPAFGCAQHMKAGRNTQQLDLIWGRRSFRA